MGCCSSTIATCPPSASAAQSPSLHVNFTKGMVLGVDDFTQEFAYLDGRGAWMVRELAGAGTLRGLAVTAEDDGARGPRLRVARGSAATRAGKLVCVPADQCGSLNAWLAVKDNADAVTRHFSTSSPPVPPHAVSPPAMLPLLVVLRYDTRLTAPVPIPGDPCRSDSALMAPSRVADDFRIELHVAGPGRPEDGMRAFVAWLRRVPLGDTSPPSLHDEAGWLAALQQAAPSWYPHLPPAPPASPHLSPPLPIVRRNRWPDFVRFAFRFWALQVAPHIGPMCGDPAVADDGLVLAHVHVPVLFAGGVPAGAWQVAGPAGTIVVEQEERPILIPGRLLQEWVLSAEADGDTGAMALAQATDMGAQPTFAGLRLTGAMQVAFTSTAAALTLDRSHSCVACTAAVTLTLPKAAPALRGRVYVVKAAGGDCQLAAAAGDTVEGAATHKVAAKTAATVICDGASAWLVVATSA